MKFNQNIEDYLKSIYEIELEHGKVATTVLAVKLNVKPASVTGMIKKLADMRLVSHTPYQGIKLTKTGHQTALGIVRRHRIIETYLVEKMDFSWDEVHAEAENLEHVVSDKMIDRMDTLLGHPVEDPHGAPIPCCNGDVPESNKTKLSELTTGQSAIISQIDDRNAELLRYVGAMGFYPDIEISIFDVAPFNGPISVKINDTTHQVGQEAASHIFVKKIK